jgi:GNAT superfamily N-acetyltransferase
LRINKSKVCNLKPDTYNKCYNLNFRGEGFMREQLVSSRRFPKDYPAKVYYIMDGEVLAAWALVNEKPKMVNFYTRKSYRRKGLGSRLSRQISKDYPIKDYAVTYHDDKSREFFDNTNYRKKD